MAVKLTVRRMRRDDVEPCARIVAADPLWQRYGLTLPLARLAFRRTIAQAAREPVAARTAGDIAVAHQAGRPVGFVWFRRHGTFHHSGYVRWIAVAPSARGRGVGKQLMRYAEERIFRRGPNVFLTVSDFNRRAQAFYRKLGYTEVGAIPDYVVPGITERLYRKTRGPLRGRGGGKIRRRRRSIQIT
jgi:ribosomal protein S18 acetylase RimI-like enzyme